jgi:phosphoglycerate-specific signal transduction histidine kinase
MYFFNSYQVSLAKDENSPKMNQSFYIEKSNNITLKEAFNLMNGRAVNKDLTNKEGQLYNAWVQLDFKNADAQGNYKLRQFHQNYGFDLEKVLSALPIKELASEQD